MSEVKLKPDPTDWVEFVLERFVYNYKSDTVHWKSIYSEDGCGGQITGNANPGGYKVVRVCGPNRSLHSIVWILVTGKKPELELDHIDGNRANNAYRNLRDVSRSANMHNTKVKGYYWNKKACKWRAVIKINWTKQHLGYFDTEQEARAAYEAAKKLHGFIYR